jgi:hypothetical protein
VTNCETLLARVEACRSGEEDWREFADASLDLLKHLFVPPLRDPYVEYETSTLSGTDRRDAIFPNRMIDPEATLWGYLRFELNAKLIVIDFKNFAPDKEAVIKTLTYVRPEMGRLALICCREPPQQSALVKRNQQFKDNDSSPILLFLTPSDLREMCDRKERGEDPADLIADLVDLFYIQLE